MFEGKLEALRHNILWRNKRTKFSSSITNQISSKFAQEGLKLKVSKHRFLLRKIHLVTPQLDFVRGEEGLLYKHIGGGRCRDILHVNLSDPIA